MSILDSIPLPPVVKRIQPVEPEKKNEPFEIELDEKAPQSPSQFIIIYSRDPEPAELGECREYGKTVVWGKQHINVSYDKIDFQYLFVDVRVKEARKSLQVHDLSKYNIVLLVPWYGKLEDFIEQVQGKHSSANVLTSIPTQTVNQEQFHMQLTDQKFVSPSLLKTVFKLVVRCFTK